MVKLRQTPALMRAVAVSSIDWETWLHAPGMPPVKNSYDGSLATAAYDLAAAWHTADVMGIGADPPAAAAPDNLQGWGTAQVCARVLLQKGRLCGLAVAS